ncbi:SigE family RNA polymerase sigma factor [Nocardioides sp. AN3]
MAAGRREPFAEFVALRSAALQRAAYLIVGDVGLAEDLVQEALTRTYLAWPRLRDPHRAEAYARKAVTTTAIDWSRHRRWRAERAMPPPDVPSPDHAADVDERTWLWLCLLRLPVRQRAAIVLRYYEDLTERETAEAMGCAIGTVKSQVAAGLAQLRPLVREDLLPQEASP